MKVKEMDELVFLWREYAKARDKKLTKDAQHLKKDLREYVSKLPAFVEQPKYFLAPAVKCL